MLSVGDKAFDFTLTNHEGENVTLSAFKGNKVVLYFYPKDDTPGCTTEACAFRDAYDELLDKGAVVIGISADSEASHERFRNKYHLPFHLLSDTDKKVIEKYGAWGQKSMYGKTYMGIIRSTYLIDEEGIVSHIWPKVSPKKHLVQVLEALQ